MAISTFPGGYSHHNKPAGLNITSVEWGSTNQLVTIANGIKAVSATTYWREKFGTLYLAHSYAFALGDYIVFIQHTLKSIITPEFVKGITDMLIHNYNTNITRKKAQQIEWANDDSAIASSPSLLLTLDEIGTQTDSANKPWLDLFLFGVGRIYGVADVIQPSAHHHLGCRR
jgi:hypothetical protein